MGKQKLEKKRKYTCEICNTKVDDFDIAFFEVHQINGNKADNREQNLKCLCIRYHSQIVQTHTAHYTSNGRRMLLQLFEEKYRKKIIGRSGTAVGLSCTEPRSLPFGFYP